MSTLARGSDNLRRAPFSRDGLLCLPSSSAEGARTLAANDPNGLRAEIERVALAAFGESLPFLRVTGLGERGGGRGGIR